jgi:hypothetical protein
MSKENTLLVLDSILNTIIDKFCYSRTAQYYIENSGEDGLFTSERMASYKPLSDIKFLNLDKEAALNLATCVKSPVPDATVETSRLSRQVISQDIRNNIHTHIRRLDSFYQKQSATKYANCQLQAIFFDFFVLKYFLHENDYSKIKVHSMICTISQPCHAFNIVYITSEESMERDWYIYDAWTGKTRVHLGTFSHEIGPQDLHFIQDRYGFRAYEEEYPNKATDMLRLYLRIMLTYGPIFGVEVPADITNLAKERGMDTKDYLTTPFGFSDCINYYPIGLTQEQFRYHYDVYEKKRRLEN